jgi:hypothetical protein
VSTIEKLLERKSSGSGLEKRDYGRMGSATPLSAKTKLALTSPTSGGRSVGIVRSRTQATESGTDNGVWHLGLPGFWTLSIIRKNNNLKLCL